MSENSNESSKTAQLPACFAFKEAMATFYSSKGEAIPVTVLRYEPWIITQIKTIENDGYTAVQVACRPKKLKNSNQAELGHFKKSGQEQSFRYIKEIRMPSVDGFAVGQTIAIESLAKGDVVQVTGTSKGHGFVGSVKRFNFAGGPASHGSKFHRRPGSSGNRTWPGRVMPGKKFPGHWGDEQICIKNLEIVDVRADESAILIKGSVPGARHALIELSKESSNG